MTTQIKIAPNMTPQAALKQRDALVQTLKTRKAQVIARGAWSPVITLTDGDNPRPAGHELNEFAVDLFTRGLELADVVIWEPDLWQAAVVGSDNLAGASFPGEAYVEGSQVWVGAEPLVSLSPGDDDAEALSTFFGVPLPLRAVTHLVLSVPGTPPRSTHVAFIVSGDDPIPYLRMLPSLYVGQPIVLELSAFAAAQLFMQQRFVRATREALPKPKNSIRRMRDRLGQLEPTIKRVTLRREAVTTRDEAGVENAEGGNTSQYSCQWLVTGGWQRRRRGPRDDASQQYLAPVYVDTYLKGPSDKPLKLPKATVLKVKR